MVLMSLDISVLCGCSVGILFCVYLLIRNDIIYSYYKLWNDAIYKYHIYCINNHIQSQIDYNDVMDYNKFFWRLFDFNKYHLIQDKEKLDILKRFMSTTHHLAP